VSRDTLLLVTTSYPERRDGSEAAGAFVADLAEQLASQLPVRVVAPGMQAGMIETDGALTVRRFASPGRPLSLLSPSRPQDWPAIIGALRSLRAQTLAADADNRVAHTLALWTLPSGWAAATLQSAHGVPYSVWALGSDIWSLGRLPLVRSILRRVIRGASHRYADGLQLAEDAARIGGVPFEFLPSTRRLDAQRTRPLASAPPYRLLFLGRWHPNKGIDLLMEALALLQDADWTRISEVRIAGGGPLEALVRERVAALQSIGRPVRLDGFLGREQASSAIGNADWLLIPSRIESIPVVFSDAMKLGCPVIATPVGDLPRLFSELSIGILTEDTAPSNIAQAINVAIATDVLSFEPGMRLMAERFDLKTGVVDHLLRAVASTLARDDGARR
jgi:glycosyltransferase involved in cell wall biosynthesis